MSKVSQCDRKTTRGYILVDNYLRRNPANSHQTEHYATVSRSMTVLASSRARKPIYNMESISPPGDILDHVVPKSESQMEPIDDSAIDFTERGSLSPAPAIQESMTPTTRA